jgi:TRAP-type uncharacterized transport system substrate-binding protein
MSNLPNHTNSPQPAAKPFKLRSFVVSIVILGLGWLVYYGVNLALPPKLIVIETGPVGGTYHDTALLYARHFEEAGLNIEIRPNPQSLQTIDRLNADVPRGDAAYVDIGFTVQALSADKYPNVQSAGVIQLQPLFAFYNRQLGEQKSPASLKGKRIVMPPQGSASAQAATALLGLYGIDDKNTQFTYLPIAQATEALKTGLHDAGFFMLSPANSMIRSLVGTSSLAMLSIQEAQGVTRRLDYLRPIKLPYGAFDLLKSVPDKDLDMVAGTVNVMVHKDISPAVLYVLLKAMSKEHGGQTLVSSKGDFPTTVGTALTVHPLASQWDKTGTPWTFNTFAPEVASVIYKYWSIALAIVFLANFYSVCLYLFEFYETIANFISVRILRLLKHRHATGHKPGMRSRWLLKIAEAIVKRESGHHEANALYQQVSPVIMGTTREPVRVEKISH